ncbi:putative MFS-type transporter [Colletotrichum fructicola]|nr:putative MFS-type transporter [Colletotrichum fructicola]
MASTEEHDDPAWPPGTVRLEEESGSMEITPQPLPSRDPNDPLNWPRPLKYWNFGLAAFYTLMVFALIDAATPTWAPMHEQLGFSYDTLNTSYAVGCGALAIGAVILNPFALKYGRRPVYILSTAIQFGVTIWSAHQQTVADLMMVNIISCFVGAPAEVVVQMTVADVFFVNQRGTMNALFFWSTRIGASLTPLAAGYVTTSQGWRWVWWWIAIFFGLLLLAMVFGYEETKFILPPISGISHSDGGTGKVDENSKSPDLHRNAPSNRRTSLKPNGQSIGNEIQRLMSLAPFTGSTLGTLLCGPLSDWWILFASKRNKGIYEPEMRLWVMAAFAPFAPIGIILFGVGLSNGWSWPALAVSYAMCSFGTAPAGTISLTYITDAHTEIVGDAMVGVTFVRNICSFIIIFALPQWIASSGVQTVYVTIGVLITAILFGSGLFIAFGKKWRFRFRLMYRHFARRQFEPRAL